MADDLTGEHQPWLPFTDRDTLMCRACVTVEWPCPAWLAESDSGLRLSAGLTDEEVAEVKAKLDRLDLPPPD